MAVSTSDTPSTATTFYGFGVNSHVSRYQVDTTHQHMDMETLYATINSTGISLNNGNLVLSTNAPSASSQLGYNDYTSTSGTATCTCTTTLQAWNTVASITLPNAGTYMVFCCNSIKSSSSLTNASF